MRLMSSTGLRSTAATKRSGCWPTACAARKPPWLPPQTTTRLGSTVPESISSFSAAMQSARSTCTRVHGVVAVLASAHRVGLSLQLLVMKSSMTQCERTCVRVSTCRSIAVADAAGIMGGAQVATVAGKRVHTCPHCRSDRRGSPELTSIKDARPVAHLTDVAGERVQVRVAEAGRPAVVRHDDDVPVLREERERGHERVGRRGVRAAVQKEDCRPRAGAAPALWMEQPRMH